MKVTVPAIFAATLLASGVAADFVSRNPKPKPAATKVESFIWTDPFTSDAALGEFDVTCEATKTFSASEYQLHDLMHDEPRGLWPYSSALRKFFSGRPYPGSWDGMDPHRYDRSLLKMPYSDLPVEVRRWIEDQERTAGKGKGLFAVYERPAAKEKVTGIVEPPSLEDAARARSTDDSRVVVFAPGALYEVLPLFVAADSACADVLSDINRYTPNLKDEAVVGWITSRTEADRANSKRDVDFTIKVQVLKEALEKSSQESPATVGKDEL